MNDEMLLKQVGKDTFWMLVENEEWDLINEIYNSLYDYCMLKKEFSQNHEEYMELVDRLEAQ